MNNDMLWFCMSYAWVDTDLSEDDLVSEASSINAKNNDRLKIFFMVFLLIIPSFSVSSIIAILTAGMSMPDFEYDKDYLINTHKRRWYKGMWILSLINPFWWLGLPLAYLMGGIFYLKLTKAISIS
jgi:hypothetical protein